MVARIARLAPKGFAKRLVSNLAVPPPLVLLQRLSWREEGIFLEGQILSYFIMKRNDLHLEAGIGIRVLAVQT